MVLVVIMVGWVLLLVMLLVLGVLLLDVGGGIDAGSVSTRSVGGGAYGAYGAYGIAGGSSNAGSNCAGAGACDAGVVGGDGGVGGHAAVGVDSTSVRSSGGRWSCSCQWW